MNEKIQVEILESGTGASEYKENAVRGQQTYYEIGDNRLPQLSEEHRMYPIGIFGLPF